MMYDIHASEHMPGNHYVAPVTVLLAVWAVWMSLCGNVGSVGSVDVFRWCSGYFDKWGCCCCYCDGGGGGGGGGSLYCCVLVSCR